MITWPRPTWSTVGHDTGMEKRIRERYGQSILEQAMHRYRIADGALRELDGFESFIYEYTRDSGAFILRIAHSFRRSENLILGEVDWINYLATELWVMNADGSGKQRLTYFNEPGHPHKRARRTAVSDSAWGPEGDSLLVLLAHYDGAGPGTKETARSQLVLVTLGQE